MSASLNLRRTSMPPAGGPSLTVLGRLVLPPRPSAPGVRTRVAVALASEPMRWGVQRALALAPELDSEAVEPRDASGRLTGADVLRTMHQAPHGVLLLGAEVTGPDAFEVLTRVRQEAPAVRVVLVAASSGPELPLRALALGAAGHIEGGAGASAFREAARAAGRGERVLSAVLAEALAARVHMDDPAGGRFAPPLNGTAPAGMTARQFQVLRLVGRGLATAAIASELALTESTVRTHKAALRETLGLDGDAALARYALDHGLR